MPIQMPSQEEAELLGQLPAGTYPATLTEVGADPSNNGDEMITFTWTIDAGGAKGRTIKDYAVLEGNGASFGMQKLIAVDEISEAAHFPYGESVEGAEDVAEGYRVPNVRVGLKTSNRYSVKEGGSYVDKTKEEFEEYEGTGEKQNPQPQVEGYTTPPSEAELKTFNSPIYGSDNQNGRPQKQQPQRTQNNEFAGEDADLPF